MRVCLIESLKVSPPKTSSDFIWRGLYLLIIVLSKYHIFKKYQAIMRPNCKNHWKDSVQPALSLHTWQPMNHSNNHVPYEHVQVAWDKLCLERQLKQCTRFQPPASGCGMAISFCSPITWLWRQIPPSANHHSTRKLILLHIKMCPASLILFFWLCFFPTDILYHFFVHSDKNPWGLHENKKRLEI